METLTSVLNIPEKEIALQELRGDQAQVLIDFMYIVSVRRIHSLRSADSFSRQALSGRVADNLTPQQRKKILLNLRQLSATSTLYPHWFPLKGMAYQQYEGASGEFYDIHRGNYKGIDLSLKVIRVVRPEHVDKMFKVSVTWSSVEFTKVLKDGITPDLRSGNDFVEPTPSCQYCIFVRHFLPR